MIIITEHPRVRDKQDKKAETILSLWFCNLVHQDDPAATYLTEKNVM